MIASMPRARHELAVGVMAFGLAATLGLSAHMKGLLLDTRDLFVVASFMTFAAICAWCLLRLGRVGLAFTTLSATALFAIILLALLDTAVLATQGRPFADPLFATADSVVAPWLNWYDLAVWFSRHPVASQLCEWVYHSIAWQPFVLIATLCWGRRPQETWRFIGMWTLSLMICQMVFALYPGVGAYAFHHVNAALTSPTSEAVSSGQLRLLTKLRTPSLAIIDNSCIGGIITFPSFHAVAAALLARGYWRIPQLRVPFAALNLAMLATAIPMGGHYVVDLLAGLAVAALAIVIFDAPPFQWRGGFRFTSTCLISTGDNPVSAGRPNLPSQSANDRCPRSQTC
ncbi:MAG TPA: phosphatase PAP2 family protein [Sphingomonas sp.]